MAAIDKLFGDEKMHARLWRWLEVNRPDALRFMTSPYQEGHSIALFPEYIDAYLLAYCPIDWVSEQIRGQYALDEGGEMPVASDNLIPLPDEILTQLRIKAQNDPTSEGDLWYIRLALPNLLVRYDDTCAALARTQAALDAAGELLTSSFPSCTWTGRLCHNYGDVSLHTQDCEYTSKKQAYTAAMAALASARGTETG